ncbi:MAG: cupin domain-containing protein [Dissulfurimicrobium sp.]|uniref:cupin domain-containing protein n=1 Tax=Dissulfurimicrobium TaxID=1769732 RepID=UPI003C73B166
MVSLKTAFFQCGDGIRFEPHPKYEGVKIAKLITKTECQKVGVSILILKPDTEIPIHVHEHEIDSIYVLSGRGEAFINGRHQEIGQGDYIFVPEAVPHGVRSSSDGELRLFIIHSPPIF